MKFNCNTLLIPILFFGFVMFLYVLTFLKKGFRKMPLIKGGEKNINIDKIFFSKLNEEVATKASKITVGYGLIMIVVTVFAQLKIIPDIFAYCFWGVFPGSEIFRLILIGNLRKKESNNDYIK